MKTARILLTCLLTAFTLTSHAQLLDKLKKAAREVETKVSSVIEDKPSAGTSSSAGSTKAKAPSSQGAIPKSSQYPEYPKMKITFQDPDLNDFSVSLYKGLPLYWYRNDYFPAGYINTSVQEDIKRMKVLTRINMFENIFLQQASPFEKPEVYNDISDLNVYTNDFFKKELVSRLLSEKGVQKYFGGKNGYKWGGNDATMFAERRSFETFIESGTYSRLVEKAAVAPREAYHLMAVKLPEYNFARNGFGLSFKTAFDGEWDTPYNLDKDKSELLWQIPAAEAESLLEHLKNAPNAAFAKSVYFVFKTEFIKSNRGLNIYNKGPKPLINRIADPIVEIYEDVFLQKKVGELNISKMLVESNDYRDVTYFSDSPLKLMDFPSKEETIKSFKIMSYKGLPLIGRQEFLEELSSHFFAPGANAIKYNYYTHVLDFSLLRNAGEVSPDKESARDKALYMASYDMLTEKTLKTMDWDFRKIPDVPYGYVSKEDVAAAKKMGVDRKLAAMSSGVPMEAYVVSRCDVKLYPGEKQSIGVEWLGFMSRNGRMDQKNWDNNLTGQASFLLTPQLMKELKSKKEMGRAVAEIYMVRKVRLLPSAHNTEYMPGPQRFVSVFSFEPGGNIADIELFADKFLTKKITVVGYSVR